MQSLTHAPPAPAPPLWPPQQHAVAFIRNRGGSGGVFAEVGVGKTAIALKICQASQRVLVLTPVSSLGVWEREAARVRDPHRVVTLSAGTTVAKAKLVEALVSDPRPIIVVTNYETFWRSPLFEALRVWGPDLLIGDEAQRLRHRTSRQSKAAALMRKWPSVRAAIGLSGTPVTTGREGLFGIFRFIDPSVFGTSWSAFAAHYLLLANMGDYVKIVGYQNTDEMDAKVRQAAYQISQSEALPWLPPQRDVFLTVELEPSSRKRYRQFARDAVAQIEGLERLSQQQAVGTALARIPLTTLLRLQQLTSGFINTNEGELGVSIEKLDACVDLVEQIRDSAESVVIFYRFDYDRDALQRALAVRREPIVTLSGGMPAKAQQAVLDIFLARQAPILLCQIHKAIGVNEMVAASKAIFYSTGYSLEDFVQAKGRIHRPGQTQPVTYYHLLVRQSVDEQVYAALQANMDIARSFIDLDYAKGFLTV